MKLFNTSLTFVLIILFNLLLTPVVWSEDTDDDDEDVVVNDETGNTNEAVQATDDEESSEEEEEKTTSSPYVTTNLLFIKPEQTEFPAGKLVKLIVGFHNNGTNNFIVDTIDASLRYPQDFSYYIQNFTGFQYNKVIEPEKEGTFEYGFTPSETFSSRPFGLVINVLYRDENKVYTNVLFNGTINIIEPDEGFDGETFFLYLFLIAIVVVLLVIAQQFFSSSIKKKIGKSSNLQRTLSNGNNGDIDYEWIPKEHLQTNKSPRTSPRQRKAASSNTSQQSNSSDLSE